MIEIAPLTEENLARAPEWEVYPWSCRYCLYGEHPELVDPSMEDRAGSFERKLAWLRRVRTEFGDCGRLLYAGEQAVGYAPYAPPTFLPTAGSYPAWPVREDAALLACLFFPDPRHRGHGLGSLLLHDVLGELRARGTPAVETFARKGSADNPSGPTEFYLRRGFRGLRDDPAFPLLRLDLR